MKKYINKSKSIQIVALALGLLVSGVVLVQGTRSNNKELTAKESSLENFKNTIKSNKNVIVNSYLLGVSIFKEATE